VLTSLHTGSIRHTNVATDVGAARAAGFDGIELQIPKLARYLDAGYSVGSLRDMLDGLRVTMIDVLMPIEAEGDPMPDRLLAECERWSTVAGDLACPAIQVVALNNFASMHWDEQRDVLVRRLTAMSDLTSTRGVRLGIEPVSFSPFRTLKQAVEVVDRVGLDRVGIVLDVWHLWTAGCDWADVAGLDPELVVCVQLGDTAPRSGEVWTDDDRTELLGDGILPLGDAITAVRSTGFDGVWSVEMLSKRHWEWDPYALAGELHDRLVAYVPDRYGD